MFFTIRYYNQNMKVTFLSLKEETIAELKIHVTKYYNIETDYSLLDLGRILSSTEKLKDLPRNEFTIYIKD